MKYHFSEPTEEDYQAFVKKILFIDGILQKYYNYNLDQSFTDLIYIQKILDDNLFSKKDKWELQALGFVFGRVIVTNNQNFDWWIINDDYGRDPIIRFSNSTLRLNVLTMISKRIENNEKVNVHELYNESIKFIEETKNKCD